jgi:hypothetical protein
LEGEHLNHFQVLPRIESIFLGSAVPLPQFAPYTDPLEILICGGSTIGAGFALDNCVTIAPEAPNATWTLERMVSLTFLLFIKRRFSNFFFQAFEAYNAVHSLST